MKISEKLLFLHRAWRYRLRTERDELSYVRGSNLSGTTVLDVGANRGIYSYWLHRAVGPQGRVFAFEPQPELGGAINKLKATYSLDRLTVVNAGVSSHSGELTLVRPRNHWAAASFHLSHDLPDADRLTVPLVSLDEYFAGVRDIPRISLVKCDVQDHEEQVFLGAEKLLREHQPDLIIEQVENCWQNGRLKNFLEGLGYAANFFYQHQLTPIERLPELRPLIKKRYLNYVFTAKHARQRRAA